MQHGFDQLFLLHVGRPEVGLGIVDNGSCAGECKIIMTRSGYFIFEYDDHDLHD